MGFDTVIYGLVLDSLKNLWLSLVHENLLTTEDFFEQV